MDECVHPWACGSAGLVCGDPSGSRHGMSREAEAWGSGGHSGGTSPRKSFSRWDTGAPVGRGLSCSRVEEETKQGHGGDDNGGRALASLSGVRRGARRSPGWGGRGGRGAAGLGAGPRLPGEAQPSPRGARCIFRLPRAGLPVLGVKSPKRQVMASYPDALWANFT